MQTVKRQTLSEQVAAKIRELIVGDSLKPGDRLPTEQQMAEQFGVSRVSIREATKALGFLGIIKSAPRRGLTVGEVNFKRTSNYIGFHIALSDFPKAQLLRTRIVLETGGLSYVAEQMQEDPTIYERLIDLNDQLRSARNATERVEADIKLHRLLLVSNGAEPLLAIDDLLQIFFIRFRKSVIAGSQRERGLREHEQIIEALHDGKPELAQTVMRHHLESHGRFM